MQCRPNYDAGAMGRKVFHPELGRYFRSLRDARELGQRQAAGMTGRGRETVGVSPGALQWLEAGMTKYPSPEQLRRLAKLYRADYASMVAEVVKHVYGVALAPSEIDAGAIAVLKAELESERSRREEAERRLARVRADLDDGGLDPGLEERAAKTKRARPA